MPCAITFVLLALGWNGPDSGPNAPPAADEPIYEVIQVKSGHELKVRLKAGDPMIDVRLAGIGTPEVGDVKVAVSSQMDALRHLVGVPDKVRLRSESGRRFDPAVHREANVYLVKDGLWVNLDLVETGHATAAPGARPALAAAQEEAKGAKEGMWASDFLRTAAQPGRAGAVRAPRRSAARSRQPVPNVRAPVIDFTPAPVFAPANAVDPAQNYGPANSGWGDGGMGLNLPYGPVVTFDEPYFTLDRNGYPLASAERARRIRDYQQAQKDNDARMAKFVDRLRTAVQDRNPSANVSASPAPGGNHPHGTGVPSNGMSRVPGGFIPQANNHGPMSQVNNYGSMPTVGGGYNGMAGWGGAVNHGGGGGGGNSSSSSPAGGGSHSTGHPEKHR
jgi:endonuclease YncB( thermonuclease family)